MTTADKQRISYATYWLLHDVANGRVTHTRETPESMGSFKQNIDGVVVPVGLPRAREIRELMQQGLIEEANVSSLLRLTLTGKTKWSEWQQ